ncbi:hypothetical protein [Paenibacillus contaminans]|uniref:Uncharacterized protein n=1 Tax=Paenibacillus contaminans TaxID=450362 RepID=A0A329MPL3_9BACL|nr:hypothetical protein [Paenibacillus contaminans]RAV19857.1 hypothetical protein DQG23_18185 [Paenibacillus contaminans]
MSKSKAGKKKEISSIDRNKFNMKIVTSDTCEACKQRCSRGIRYMERMRMPGAIGNGVPCVLTKGKAYK